MKKITGFLILMHMYVLDASEEILNIIEPKLGLRFLKKEKPASESKSEKRQKESELSYIVYLSCLSGGFANTICLAQNNNPPKLKLE